MAVRAKFTCESVKQYAGTVWDENGENPKSGFLYGYEFRAVYGKSDENKLFFASTPGGTITINAVRDGLFIPGREYYVDFTTAPIDETK